MMVRPRVTPAVIAALFSVLLPAQAARAFHATPPHPPIFGVGGTAVGAGGIACTTTVLVLSIPTSVHTTPAGTSGTATVSTNAPCARVAAGATQNTGAALYEVDDSGVRLVAANSCPGSNSCSVSGPYRTQVGRWYVASGGTQVSITGSWLAWTPGVGVPGVMSQVGCSLLDVNTISCGATADLVA